MRIKPLIGGIILISIFSLISNGCSKEPKSNEDIFSKLEGQEGIYTFKVPATLFLILARAEVPSGEMVDNLGDIDVVKLLIFDPLKSKSLTPVDISDEIFRSFGELGYEVVIKVTREGTEFAAYILENNKYVSDLMVVIFDEKSVTAIGLSGRLDPDIITQFAAEIDYDKLKEIMDGY